MIYHYSRTSSPAPFAELIHDPENADRFEIPITGNRKGVRTEKTEVSDRSGPAHTMPGPVMSATDDDRPHPAS